MFSSKVTFMPRLWRCAGLLAVLTGLLGAAPRHLVWQTGFVRIDPAVQVEPAGYAEAQLPLPAPLQERESEPLPHWQMVFLRIHLTIDSGQGVYTVEHRVISSLFPELCLSSSANYMSQTDLLFCAAFRRRHPACVKPPFSVRPAVPY